MTRPQPPAVRGRALRRLLVLATLAGMGLWQGAHCPEQMVAVPASSAGVDAPLAAFATISPPQPVRARLVPAVALATIGGLLPPLRTDHRLPAPAGRWTYDLWGDHGRPLVLIPAILFERVMWWPAAADLRPHATVVAPGHLPSRREEYLAGMRLEALPDRYRDLAVPAGDPHLLTGYARCLGPPAPPPAAGIARLAVHSEPPPAPADGWPATVYGIPGRFAHLTAASRFVEGIRALL